MNLYKVSSVGLKSLNGNKYENCFVIAKDLESAKSKITKLSGQDVADFLENRNALSFKIIASTSQIYSERLLVK